MELWHGQVQFELPVEWKLHCTDRNQNGVSVRDLSSDPTKSDCMEVSMGSSTDEKFRWMETHRCILPLCVQFTFSIKRSYKMGIIMFKSGTGWFLWIYNTYNVRQNKKCGLRNTSFARIIIHQHCVEVYTIQACGMTHSKFILNKTDVNFRFNSRMKNTDKNCPSLYTLFLQGTKIQWNSPH